MIVTRITDIDRLLEKAAKSPRKRAVFSPHNEEDPVNFFYNALLPGTYVQPHKHEEKDEYFQIIRGEVLVVMFNNSGQVSPVCRLASGGLNSALSCRIQPGKWHSVIALEPSVILEVKLGPYDPSTAKTFAPWAPSEGMPGTDPYLEQLLQLAKSSLF